MKRRLSILLLPVTVWPALLLCLLGICIIFFWNRGGCRLLEASLKTLTLGEA